MNLDENPESVYNLGEIETSVNSEPSKRPDLEILWKLSHQISSAAVPGNLCLQVTGQCAGPVRTDAFFYPRVYSLELGGTMMAQQHLIRLYQWARKASFWRCLFQWKKLPGCSLLCLRPSSPETAKTALLESLVEAIGPLQYWSVSHLPSLQWAVRQFKRGAARAGVPGLHFGRWNRGGRHAFCQCDEDSGGPLLHGYVEG